MVKRELYSFSVDYLQILDEEGNADDTLMPNISDSDIIKLYEIMNLVRAFDIKAFALQRQGRIGTYAPVIGQEASQVGSAFAVNNKDWLFPTFRENGALITRGYPMHMVLQYWGGDERGQKVPVDMNIFPIAVPVSTQIPHALGAAWASKLKGDGAAAVCYLGDGATSKGDFHESLNFAGVFKVPCVFIAQNNQWAISVPRKKQTASETLAQKAIAYGFEGLQVDGNDIFAVYKAVNEALQKAREGNGPTLIECFTYRISDHTTSDDAKRYRKAEEVEGWKKKDPITRLQKFLQKRNLWTKDYEEKLQQRAVQQIDKAVLSYESLVPAKPEEIFDYTYAKKPKKLEEQKIELMVSKEIEQKVSEKQEKKEGKVAV
jgi:pyruvate dehydrogenase E1 component alpha subunit